jgi:hypothetical protein
MSDSFAEDLSVNNVRNLKAPLTPIAWIEMDNAKGTPVLAWNPIEYIAGYKVLKNGVEVAKTRQTTYSLREGEEGEWQVIGFDSNGVESFASEPRRLGRQIIYQMPDESTTLASHEISYLPKERVAGYHGSGFVETDHDKSLIAVPVNMSNGGRYSLQLRYANGNGPVNTENKCAIRSILVDGVKVGTVVMPQRGVANWNDWGLSNVLKLTLPEGASTITIRLNAEDENMNIDTNHAIIDQLILTPLD